MSNNTLYRACSEQEILAILNNSLKREQNNNFIGFSLSDDIELSLGFISDDDDDEDAEFGYKSEYIVHYDKDMLIKQGAIDLSNRSIEWWENNLDIAEHVFISDFYDNIDDRLNDLLNLENEWFIKTIKFEYGGLIKKIENIINPGDISYKIYGKLNSLKKAKIGSSSN